MENEMGNVENASSDIKQWKGLFDKKSPAKA